MTASFAQPRSARRGPSPIAAATVALVALVTVLVLIVTGVTFAALAVAFPIAVPLAEAYNLPVSGADIALAERFAALWWAFAALAFASFGAAVVVVVKLIDFVSPASND
jgi:hypothetical protein